MAGSVKAVPGKKGVWEIRYDSIDPITEKRKQHRKHFKGTKSQADKHLVEIQNKINKGEYTDLGNIPFKEYLDTWVNTHVKNLAYRTHEGYKTIITKYIKPNLGSIKLCNLKAGHIQDYYTKMGSDKKNGGAGLCGTTVLYHHRIIREALSHAVNLGYINFNPADRVKAPRKNKPEMKILSLEQAQYIIDNYKQDKVYLPILLAIMTGMRQGEVCGLCWQDVDLDNGTISVNHALQRQGKELVLKEPKTKKSRRTIPIPGDLITELKQVQLQYKQNKLAWGQGYDPRGFVCAWEDGRPMEADWVSKQWKRIVKQDKEKAEKEKTERHIPDGVRYHDLRHTHATLLLSQGLSIKMVQERLGHESIATTGDIYSHITPAMQQEAVKILDNIFKVSS